MGNNHSIDLNSWYSIGTPESHTYERAEFYPYAYNKVKRQINKVHKDSLGKINGKAEVPEFAIFAGKWSQIAVLIKLILRVFVTLC